MTSNRPGAAARPPWPKAALFPLVMRRTPLLAIEPGARAYCAPEVGPSVWPGGFGAGRVEAPAEPPETLPAGPERTRVDPGATTWEQWRASRASCRRGGERGIRGGRFEVSHPRIPHPDSADTHAPLPAAG